MQIAVLTFEGFNELDSFVAAAILNRMKPHGWAAHITSPTEQVTSLNGVTIQRQKPRGASMRDAEEAMHYVAPVGEKALYVDRAVTVVAPFITQETAAAA